VNRQSVESPMLWPVKKFITKAFETLKIKIRSYSLNKDFLKTFFTFVFSELENKIFEIRTSFSATSFVLYIVCNVENSFF
jgi:hypothetical protein